MKKIILCLTVILILTAGTVSAQNNYGITFGADLQLTTFTFDNLFDKTKQINLWQLMISGKIEPAEDLMMLVDHGFGYATKLNNSDFENEKSMRNYLTQVSLLYQFYNDANLEIYGGLGYNFVQNYISSLIYHDDELQKNVQLYGSGFMAASQVNFNVIDNLMIKANINAAPWYRWDYRTGGTITETGGSTYLYRLTAEYDLNPDWIVKVGYGGTRSTMKEFEFNDYQVPKTTSTQGGLQVGVTYKF